jgi:hypothetical protein
MLSALLASAFAAQSANAVTKGTTAFTCSKAAPVKDFAKEHCKAGDAGTKEYGHIAIAENTKTEVTVSNTKVGPATNNTSVLSLKATVAGSVIHLTASEATATGTVQNRKEPNGEHYVFAETTTTYSGVKEELLGCTVSGITAPGGKEMVSTTPLVTTTAGKGDVGTLRPAAGSLFTEFELTGCIIGPMNLKVFGSITCKPDGATVNCNHEEATAAKSLRLQNATTGPVAGVEVSTTFKGRANSGEPYTPLSPTTVETT